jgi:hypothetical protein
MSTYGTPDIRIFEYSDMPIAVIAERQVWANNRRNSAVYF